MAELKAVLTTLAEENRLSEHVGARDAEGNTAFHLACYHGHVECVRLLEENSSNTLEQTDAGLSGLMMAAERGYIKLCQHLLPTAELEATCNKGWTAFIHACAAGQADCVELLVRADCDTKVCTCISAFSCPTLLRAFWVVLPWILTCAVTVLA